MIAILRALVRLGDTNGLPKPLVHIYATADHNDTGAVSVQDVFDFLTDFFTENTLSPPGGDDRVSHSDIDNPYGYCGYYADAETRGINGPNNGGLYHVRHRVYDPVAGRWLTRDPAGFVDGMNLYEYCAGGAVGCWDPMGLHECNPEPAAGGMYTPYQPVTDATPSEMASWAGGSALSALGAAVLSLAAELVVTGEAAAVAASAAANAATATAAKAAAAVEAAVVNVLVRVGPEGVAQAAGVAYSVVSSATDPDNAAAGGATRVAAEAAEQVAREASVGVYQGCQ